LVTTDRHTPSSWSIAVSGNLGDRDRRDVIDALRRLAEIDKATRRHPSNGRPAELGRIAAT
jgi:hypothetical protein